MRRLLLCALAAALTAGCGVPVTGAPEVLATDAVPYNLLKSPTASAADPAATGPVVTSPVITGSASGTVTPSAGSPTTPAHVGVVAVEVAFVVDEENGDQKVVLQRRRVPAGAPAQMAQDLLSQLQSGPTETEHTEGLGSAIPSGTGLAAAQVAGGLVTIDLTGESPVQASDRLPLAVAQIVLTATSLPGVSRVLLLRDGKPVDPPLPNGALISARELTRRDYESLIRS